MPELTDTPDDIAALVASDDCFITLATKLDAALHAADGVDRTALEDMIQTLLYLQHRFAVTKKSSNY